MAAALQTEQGDLAWYTYRRSFFDAVVVQFLAEHAHGILELGGGHPILPDDEKQSRDVAAHMLIRLGYRVATAADGTEAIELYRQSRDTGRPYDVVILDLTIPGGLGGAEVVKKILEIEPQAKAVASSGYSNDPVITKFRKYGFNWVQQESTFWRRSLWEKAGGRLDDRFKYAADFFLWREFAKHTDLVKVSSFLGGYRSHGDQVTGDPEVYRDELPGVGKPPAGLSFLDKNYIH